MTRQTWLGKSAVLILLTAGLGWAWSLLAQQKAQRPPRRPYVAAQLAITSPPLPAREQLKRFRLPEEFEIELVLEEGPGIGKFIAVAFDAKGRLWTMTALEYPVDANDDPEASKALFERGGRDKVLVIDDPYAASAARPRVFAAGLAIPLGILPYRDGVFAQYGPEIRFYRDLNGDGSADTYEVVLTGFGTQDSHLFPHQFTRVPGNWILMAQGLFNESVVRRPDGKPFANGREAVVFRHCKLARFRPDGSDFELLTAGPNNIWGLTVSRVGEIWIQEANDLGYPIIPFEPGGRYPTPSPDLLKPYQPMMPPPLAPPQMGGTGLSGLALADDRDGWPTPWGRNNAAPNEPLRFYVANPVIGRIQMIEAAPTSVGRYRYRKLEDFLSCDDPRFRPVAIQFGPDGCLYVVDWYNKIISHNEVPRNHPERDRTRGRIWRIRHKGQKRQRPPDLTKLEDRELLAFLGADNNRLAHLAWQEIADRRAKQLAPELAAIVQDRHQPVDRRLGALWALEELEPVPTELLVQLAHDSSEHLRYHAVRIAGAQARSEGEFLAVAELVLDDPAPRVRAALGDALRRVELRTERGLRLLLSYVRAPLHHGDAWERYERAFERFLARWAMEHHAEQLRRYLASRAARTVPQEGRMLAYLALGDRGAVEGLARQVPRIGRPLEDEEIRMLAQHMQVPQAAAAIERLLRDDATRIKTLESLLRFHTELTSNQLRDAVEEAALQLAEVESQRPLVLRLASAYRLTGLRDHVLRWAMDRRVPIPQRVEALQALRRLGVPRAAPLLSLLGEKPLREAVLLALTESPNATVTRAVLESLDRLAAQERRLVLTRLAASRRSAEQLVQAVLDGQIGEEELPVEALDRMRIVLPDNRHVQEWWEAVEGRVRYVLRMHGGPDDYVLDTIDLEGPFTVEAWVRLAPGITNHDGILGRPGVLDMNFYNARFRVWVAGHHDVVIAQRPIQPGSWTYVAVTRDPDGRFRLYVNGELEDESKVREVRPFKGLQVGRTIPPAGGTEGEILELRIWNRALEPREIRERFDLTYRDGVRPAGLVNYFVGRRWGRLSGSAEVVPVVDGPPLLTVKEAKQRAAKFAYYRRLVAQGQANLTRGKKLFEQHCLTCHTVRNRGGKIGPPLDGVGLKGLESLLRNVLTPSAAMEGGYRMYQVVTKDGRIVQGLLVQETDEAVILRQQGLPDVRIPREEIAQAGYLNVSVMPEGILESLSPREARDLLGYILTIR